MTHQWQERGRPARLERRYEFENYQDLRDFLDRAAELSEREGLYPDMGFGRDYVNMTIHSDETSGAPEPEANLNLVVRNTGFEITDGAGGSEFRVDGNAGFSGECQVEQEGIGVGRGEHLEAEACHLEGVAVRWQSSTRSHLHARTGISAAAIGEALGVQGGRVGDLVGVLGYTEHPELGVHPVEPAVLGVDPQPGDVVAVEAHVVPAAQPVRGQHHGQVRLTRRAREAATDVVDATCLAVLDAFFSDDAVHCDTANCNAARIWKLYGTTACKGDDTAERPHRKARIVSAPDEAAVVPDDGVIAWLLRDFTNTRFLHTVDEAMMEPVIILPTKPGAPGVPYLDFSRFGEDASAE